MTLVKAWNKKSEFLEMCKQRKVVSNLNIPMGSCALVIYETEQQKQKLESELLSNNPTCCFFTHDDSQKIHHAIQGKLLALDDTKSITFLYDITNFVQAEQNALTASLSAHNAPRSRQYVLVRATDMFSDRFTEWWSLLAVNYDVIVRIRTMNRQNQYRYLAVL